MFSTLAGLPLSEYVRRRRLTRATAEIVAGQDSVLAVATTYGYRSADAFTRAFRAMHGITPSQARLPGAVLRSLPEGFDDRLRGLADVAGLPAPVSVTTAFEGRAEGSSCDYHRAVATTTPPVDLPDDLDVLEVAAGD